MCVGCGVFVCVCVCLSASDTTAVRPDRPGCSRPQVRSVWCFQTHTLTYKYTQAHTSTHRYMSAHTYTHTHTHTHTHTIHDGHNMQRNIISHVLYVCVCVCVCDCWVM